MRLAAFTFALLATTAMQSHAQTAGQAQRAGQGQQGQGQRGDFILTLGAAGFLHPQYEGSKDYEFHGWPVIDLRYRDIAFLSVQDGLGVNALNVDGLKAGPVLKYKIWRDQDDNAALRGLGDVDLTFELGGFAKYDMGVARGSVEIRKGLNGHEGWVADLAADAVVNFTPQLTLSAGPRASWADGDFTRAYFGVDARQAARSGYNQSRPSSGFYKVGVGANLRYAFTREIGVSLFGRVDRMVGDAANAQIVKERGDRYQGIVGLSVTYSFNF